MEERLNRTMGDNRKEAENQMTKTHQNQQQSTTIEPGTVWVTANDVKVCVVDASNTYVWFVERPGEKSRRMLRRAFEQHYMPEPSPAIQEPAHQQQSTAMDDLKDMKPPQLRDAALDYLEALKSGPYPRNAGETKATSDTPEFAYSAKKLREPQPTSTANGRQQIIDKMTAAVMSDRNRAYGEPEGNFGNIAAYWNIHLEARKPGPLTSLDVAIMMKLMKVARLSTNPTHVDSWVDSAGYAACGGGIVVSKEEKK